VEHDSSAPPQWPPKGGCWGFASLEIVPLDGPFSTGNFLVGLAPSLHHVAVKRQVLGRGPQLAET